MHERVDLFPLWRLLYSRFEAIRAGRNLILQEKLYPHLLEIDKAANERMETLMPQLMKAAGVNETLKAADQMRWAGLMNALKAQAEEMILSELIFDKEGE